MVTTGQGQAPTGQRFWKDLLLPTVTVVLAVFGAWQTFDKMRKEQQTADARARLDALKLDLESQLRGDARERNQQEFMLKVFDFVQDTVKEKDANERREAAALALVDTLPDTDMKLSLSRILKAGAASEQVRQQAAAVARTVDANLVDWANWDVDVFACESSGERARDASARVVDAIRQGRASGRIRARALAATTNAGPGYRYSGWTVAYNAGSEDAMAAKLKQLLSDVGGEAVQLRPVATPTRWYLSAFICPPASN